MKSPQVDQSAQTHCAQVQCAQIVKLQSPFLQHLHGQQKSIATTPTPPESAAAGSLVYVSTPQQMTQALQAPASIIIALQAALNGIDFKSHQVDIFQTPAISAAMAVINSLFDQKMKHWPQGISDKADIHPSAKIGANVSIGAFTVVGENVIIEDHVHIGPQCTLETGAHIGMKTYLHPQVFIGANCRIGKSCEIHPHTTIGSDGFGFVSEPKTNINHKIAQLGIVVIEDHVEIGANCAIDRATLTETRICSGTKLDNLIHVAHNCTFGRNGLFAAGFATAGSTKIGDNFKCGGTVAVVDHIQITDNVTIGGRSTVTKDITEPGAYTGYPVEKFRDGLRTLASLPALPELRKDVSDLQKRLNQLETARQNK